MEKLVVEISRENVEDFLRDQHFKVKPELVTAILEAMKTAYESGDFPFLIEAFLWGQPINSMLENE